MIERAVAQSTVNRARLDLAMPGELTAAAEDNEPAPAEADFVTDAAIREQETTNMIAALRHADWRTRGNGGAAELPAIKPSTLTYRMTVFGIRKDERAGFDLASIS